MAGYVCTVAGGKGGVGKTTTAINLAAVFEDEGYDVVVVDADLGMANLAEMLGVDPEGSIHEILAGDATVSEGLTDAEGEITAVPGEQSLEAFADADPAKLRKVINTLKNAYDVVLVDTGAGLSHETTVPLGLGDGVLLVTTLGEVAVSDTVKTADLVERVDGSVIGGLVTRVIEDTDVGAVEAELTVPLLGVVPSDVPATRDEPMVLNAPDSPAAQAYRSLASELSAVFFQGADPGGVNPVFDNDWFEGDDEDESDDGDDDSGRFGLFG